VNELLFLLLTGLGLGALHSLDPDHLVAMSTLVGRRAEPVWRALGKGAVWGIGHTLSLAALGLVLIMLDARVTGLWERGFEVGVGVLLIYLGLVRLHDAHRGPHLHPHRHGAEEHIHFHLHPAAVQHESARAHYRHTHAPLWIGMLHGLAGTAGMMALLPAVVIGDAASYMVYMLGFGLGSTLSMALFCGGLGHMLERLRGRSNRAGTWLSATVGGVSLTVGILWIGNALFA
jgi:nickel/cobalt exporter